MCIRDSLYGKTVSSVAAGWNFTLALCSDGSLVAWGDNASGQIGDNTSVSRNAPVAVNAVNGTSALYGSCLLYTSAPTPWP